MMLEDKVIVIVGATGGIGSTLTRQLSSTGARLVLVARDGESLAALASSY
jgi:short-subunit dehydrogenase